MPTAKDVQQRLGLLGYYKGKIDGEFGPQSLAATELALDDLGKFLATEIPNPFREKYKLPETWFSSVPMERIICHWTAGSHNASNNDRKHYHILIEGDGDVIRGFPTIAGNSRGGPKSQRASHTLNCNTGSIGVSMCCMGGAQENPFKAGKWPMTITQWERMAEVVAELCDRYKIPITPKTVLSHAEVQPNLGIKQRGKWDFTRIPFEPNVKGHKACGDKLRADVARKLGERA